MARIRTLKPDFFLDEELSEVSVAAQLLLAGLWTVADREGRLEDRPKRIKAQVFPYRDMDVEALLGELARIRRVLRYEVAGRGFIQVLDWARDQRPHVKEAPSAIPVSPPEYTEHQSSTVRAPTQHGRVPGEFPATSPPRPLGSGIVDPDQGSGNRDPCLAPAAVAPVAEVYVLTPPPAGRPQRKEAQGESPELWRALEATWLDVMGVAYASGNGATDGATVQWLLKSTGVTPAEVVKRWRRLLEWAKGSANGYPGVTGFVSLRKNWNAPEVLGLRGPDGKKATGGSSLRPENYQEGTVDLR